MTTTYGNRVLHQGRIKDRIIFTVYLIVKMVFVNVKIDLDYGSTKKDNYRSSNYGCKYKVVVVYLICSTNCFTEILVHLIVQSSKNYRIVKIRKMFHKIVSNWVIKSVLICKN